ncbi:ABC transporter permease [Leifsonia shinshuensis]|uniref:FtsX-like permease family protein n=1 Tax=Leifsonia shinshuensis TaxID=150026 RepID=UPI001F50FE36|nr:FtsX-like permease family protein [Leifsonia shinshuensis]MCI0156234.1 ABC transporter permease [Leifsonia shinshuensis]
MNRTIRLARWLSSSIVRRYAPSLAIAAAGLALFVAFVPVVANVAGEAATSNEGLGAPVLRTAVLGGSAAVGSAVQPVPLTSTALDGVRAIRGVESVFGWTQAFLNVETRGEYSTLTITPRFAELQPPLVEGREPRGDREIVMGSRWATSVDVGSTLPAIYNARIAEGEQEGVTTTVTVVGFYDSGVPGVDGEGTTYGTKPWTLGIVGAGLGREIAWMDSDYAFPTAYVVATNPGELSSIVSELRARNFAVDSLATLLTSVPPLQSFLSTMRLVLAGLLVVFLVVVAWAVAGSVLTAKRAEIGLLRALGWSRGEIGRTFVMQFGLLGLIVGSAGVIAGSIALAIVLIVGGDAEFFGLPVTLQFDAMTIGMFAAIGLAPVVLFVVAAVVPVTRISRIPPDDVLRDLTS